MSSAELEPVRAKIVDTDHGSFLVDTGTLVNLPLEQMASIRHQIAELIVENPEYEFMEEQVMIPPGGIKISWRRKRVR